jgi:hypothetical protein
MRTGRLRARTAATIALLTAAGMGALASPTGAVASAGRPAAKVTSVAALLRHPAPANRLANPARALPHGWSRSGDEILSVQGDASGLHVLAATESSGYAWRTVATLGDAGVDTTQWIGQACLTGNGKYAVVIYAPREVTNMAGLMGVLGRAAVVTLATGQVRQLGGGYSVAYFDPGCGTGSNVVLTRAGWGGDTPGLPANTGLQVVDAATARTVFQVTEPGQVTSAVPYGTSIVAAGRPGLVQIRATGRVQVLVRSALIPFRLVPDAAGGIGYETTTGSQVQVRRFAQGKASLIGRAAAESVQLQGSGGRVWLTGAHASGLGQLPRSWRAADVPAGSAVSTTGVLAVTGIGTAGRSGATARNPAAPLSVVVKAQVLTGAKSKASFTVQSTPARVMPVAASGPGKSAGTTLDVSASRQGRAGAAAANAVTTTAGSSTTPVSADRTCAIALDDPNIQAYQPTFQQTEWAADQAVQGDLTNSRPSGLYGSSLPAYTPQGLFPLPALDGGGQVPAQVLLGLLTQESNLEQASAHDIQGQASNPLTSFNWYGDWVSGSSGYVESNPLAITWAASDCGYGIGQVTTGMCLSKGQNGDPECQYATPLSSEDQLAVAVDYQANIAASVQFLANDWNQLYSDGIIFNKQSSASSPEADYVNAWYMALWAYNSGLEPGTSALGNTTGCTPLPTCTDGNGDWGLGYADNPANPAYPPDRPQFPFTSANTAPGGGTYNPTWDQSHPQYWAYQEKVIGWAYNSVTLYNYNTGSYQQAFAWASGLPTTPPLGSFCTGADYCNPGVLNTSSVSSNGDACTLTGSYQDHCWWHWPLTWTYCTTSSSCGTSVLTYAAGAAAPANPTIAPAFAQACTIAPLPTSAVVVGADKAALGCPGQNWTSAGSMQWSFGAASNGTYPSKINFDQIGAGFGGHFWFGYTIPNDAATSLNVVSTTPKSGYSDLQITGTWPVPSSVIAWGGAQIYVHLPSIGAWDPQANYQISPGGGAAVQHRVVNQAAQANSWISLGLYSLGSGAKVSLSNVTYSGLGYDIAWNDVAFVRTGSLIGDYVAMGDSYSSGEGNQPFDPDSDYSYNGMRDACHRSGSTGAGLAYSQQFDVPGENYTYAKEAQTPGSGVLYQFLACSGEVSSGMDFGALDKAGSGYGSAFGQVSQSDMVNTPWVATSPQLSYDEIPQVSTGWLNSQTTLVTLTAGGDDARFAKVLSACVLSAPKESCADGSYTMAGDPEPLTQYEAAVINAMGAHLKQLYSDVAKAAPNAEIIVMGYPRLFGGDTSAAACPVDAAQAILNILGQIFTVGAFSFDIPASVTQWMNSMGDLLNSVISTQVSSLAATGVKIRFINPNSPGDGLAGFEGHNVCDASGNNPPSGGQWINGVITYSESGSDSGRTPPFTAPGQGSFHPNADGQEEFGALVSACQLGAICTLT